MKLDIKKQDFKFLWWWTPLITIVIGFLFKMMERGKPIRQTVGRYTFIAGYEPHPITDYIFPLIIVLIITILIMWGWREQRLKSL